jgi:hypothetical protein
LSKGKHRVQEIGDNFLSFITDLSDIYLLDMDHVPCLVLGTAADSRTIREQCQKITNELAFIFAVSDATLAQVKIGFSNSPFLLLSVKQVRQLLKASNAIELLRNMLLEQVSKTRLIPYNTFLPATGNMFFGRARELGRLRDESQMSFAIAGPGRIGKTSIIKRHKGELTRAKDARGPLTFLIDFIDCADQSPDGVARFFATKIEATRWSDRMTAGQLMNFLRYQCNLRGGPLNLLFDEVDEVCQGEAFNSIA